MPLWACATAFNMAGVYGAVLVEGVMHKGDPVELLN